MEREISPGFGLNPLRFGMSIDEVKKILGRPHESIEVEDGENSYITLEYPEKRVSLSFDLDEGLRLSSIEVDEGPFTLFGESLFPRNRDRVLDLLRRNLPIADMAEIEESAIELIGQSLWVPSLRGTFYFSEEGELEQFQWSPFFNSGDEIMWPESPIG